MDILPIDDKAGLVREVYEAVQTKSTAVARHAAHMRSVQDDRLLPVSHERGVQLRLAD
jgi:hypothetical protein